MTTHSSDRDLLSSPVAMSKNVRRSSKARGPNAQSDTAADPGQASAPIPTLTSYDVFLMCVARSENLIRLHAAAHGRRAKPERFMGDAHRAAIVLAVSALDAFVRTFIIARSRTIIADKTRPLPGPLRDHIKRFVKDDDLLEAARKDDLLDRVAAAFRADFERRSFQGTKAIAEYMKLVGFDDVFHDVAIDAGVNEETLCRSLDRFTDRRHTIAHRGDYDLSQNPPKENVVTKRQATDCIKLVKLIAKHVHELGA